MEEWIVKFHYTCNKMPCIEVFDTYDQMLEYLAEKTLTSLFVVDYIGGISRISDEEVNNIIKVAEKLAENSDKIRYTPEYIFNLINEFNGLLYEKETLEDELEVYSEKFKETIVADMKEKLILINKKMNSLNTSIKECLNKLSSSDKYRVQNNVSYLEYLGELEA